MSQHKFIPYEKPKDCEQCKLFGEPCMACSIIKDTCQECNGRANITDHVYHQNCERCGQLKDCTYFPKVGKRVCLVCAGLYLREVDIKASEKQSLGRIGTSGDLFNAKMLSLDDLEAQVNANEGIDESEKQRQYHELLCERYGKLNDIMFEADQTKHEAYVEKKAIENKLRQYGEAVRKEIRDRIRESDEKYRPIPSASIKKVAPKVGAAKKRTAFEKMVDQYAAATGMNWEDAKKALESGWPGAKTS